MTDHEFIYRYLGDLSGLLKPSNELTIKLIHFRDLLLEVKNNNKKVLIFGNGGSAADDRYGFAVFSGTGVASILDAHDDRYSVLITKDKARLAGIEVFRCCWLPSGCVTGQPWKAPTYLGVGLGA